MFAASESALHHIPGENWLIHTVVVFTSIENRKNLFDKIVFFLEFDDNFLLIVLGFAWHSSNTIIHETNLWGCFYIHIIHKSALKRKKSKNPFSIFWWNILLFYIGLSKFSISLNFHCHCSWKHSRDRSVMK